MRRTSRSGRRWSRSVAGRCRWPTRRAPWPSTGPAASAAVAFDVSHLGTVRVAGRRRVRPPAALVEQRPARGSHPGRAQYTHLLDEDGFGGRRHHRVVGRRRAVRRHAQRLEHQPSRGGHRRRATSPSERAIIAVQGPRPGPAWRRSSPEAAAVPPFRASTASTGTGATCLVAGTGYTGEDGVECAVPAEVAAGLLGRRAGDRGRSRPGWVPATRCASKRGCPLHGHELGPGITPLQAGLGWVVGWDKGDFIGRAALGGGEGERSRPPAAGLVAEGRQPLRDGSLLARARSRSAS